MECKPLSCVCGKLVIPHRVIMTIMALFCIFYAYIMRAVMSIAITEMVIAQPIKDIPHDNTICPSTGDDQVSEQHSFGEFKWTEHEQEIILSVFFWGYVITHLPGGLLADKLGARHVLGGSVLISAVVTVFNPIAASYGGYLALAALRFLVGLSQGAIYPGVSSLLSKWAPKTERSSLAGVAYSGQLLGQVLGNALTGVIISEMESWSMPFYIWSLLTVMWYAVWLLTVFSMPDSHPFITEKELNYLHETIEQDKQKVAVPWKKLLSSPVLYAVILAQIGHDYIIFTMATNLPKYMKDVLRFNIRMNGFLSALPFIAVFISTILSGYICDFITKRNWMSIVNMRRTQTIVSAMGPSTCLVAVGYIGCSRYWAVGLFTIGMFLMGPFYCGTKVTAIDITIHFSGVIMAIMNGLGALIGAAGPLIIAALAPDNTVEQWQLVFWVIWVVAAVTTVVYVLLVKAERASWDYLEGEQPTT